MCIRTSASPISDTRMFSGQAHVHRHCASLNFSARKYKRLSTTPYHRHHLHRHRHQRTQLPTTARISQPTQQTANTTTQSPTAALLQRRSSSSHPLHQGHLPTPTRSSQPGHRVYVFVPRARFRSRTAAGAAIIPHTAKTP